MTKLKLGINMKVFPVDMQGIDFYGIEEYKARSSSRLPGDFKRMQALRWHELLLWKKKLCENRVAFTCMGNIFRYSETRSAEKERVQKEIFAVEQEIRAKTELFFARFTLESAS